MNNIIWGYDMSINFLYKKACDSASAASSYVKKSCQKFKNGAEASAVSVLYRGISKPLMPQITKLENKATKIVINGQQSALKRLDNGVAEITDCAKSAQKLLNTVENAVKTGTEIVGFVAGLYVFNLPGKSRNISSFACTAQKIAGLSIAVVASLHWVGRMTKPFIEERVLGRLLPKDFGRWK